MSPCNSQGEGRGKKIIIINIYISPKFVRFEILTPEIMKTMKRDAMNYDG